MFYPEESLKKGGRFYLCWVADSWPLCFATITHRQLWSQDIRKICDDLLEVMNNESGRPTSRFSLRLSSQLMRGLVRLYQRKVIIMLGDLCMMNARVMKNSNKKFNIHEPVEEMERQLFPLLELPAIVAEPVPEPEERVEEILQQSGNIVTNIQDITLKEAAIPDIQLPANDGFGEENPAQSLQVLHDRTVEQMLGAASPAGPGAAQPPAERSRDRTHSRLAPDAQMERISDHDVTLFRKSMGQDLLPEEFEKDISGIGIPDIPRPDLPVPIEKEVIEPEQEAIPEPVPTSAQREKRAVPEPVEEELEELEELEPQAKRRRPKDKLIIDKRTILPSNFLRARIANIAVELRCENSSDDIADLRVPWDVLVTRPAAAGARFRSGIARALTRMFSKNLGSGANPLGQREMELVMASRSRRTQPALAVIPEEPPAVQEPPPLEPQLQPMEQSTPDRSALAPDLRPSVAEDIADLPTQKIVLSQKRPASQGSEAQPKRQKTCGVMSFRQLQRHSQEREQDIVEKENIPDNRQTIPPPEIMEPINEALVTDIQIHPPADHEKRLTSLLQEAGLADMEIRPEINPVEEETQRKTCRRQGSESSETMLGSLDRTKVSLGDSEQTTDSKRFIRDQWGTEGTMVKILKAIKARATPVTVDSLLAYGPVLPGCLRIIAARSFTSILKLKQHGFVKVQKDADTLEITDILLGPKFDIH